MCLIRISNIVYFYVESNIVHFYAEYWVFRITMSLIHNLYLNVAETIRTHIQCGK